MREAMGCPRAGERTPEFWAWANMKARCNNPKNPRYADYGGRGIRVCAEWERSFPDFLRHVGLRPSQGHSLERSDNSKGYEPGNVVWATRAEQQNNRRETVLVEFRGETLPLAEAARRSGIPYQTVVARIRRGHPPETWFSTGRIGRDRQGVGVHDKLTTS